MFPRPFALEGKGRNLGVELEPLCCRSTVPFSATPAKGPQMECAGKRLCLRLLDSCCQSE